MRVRWPPPTVVGMTTDPLQPDPVANSRTWARVFAAIYDPSLWIGERVGMRRYRREHVRSDSATLARWQDRLAGPWQRFAEGCRCNRATLELMDACGFRLEARPAAWLAMPPIIRPLIIGRATITATRGQEA
jgi:hypothetical protein